VYYNLQVTSKGVDRKISRGGGATKKIPKNSTIKPLSTIFVPDINIHNPPAADVHMLTRWINALYSKLSDFGGPPGGRCTGN